jgi:hypothetical protein
LDFVGCLTSGVGAGNIVHGPIPCSSKQSEVDLKAGEEHQQQLSQFSEEVRDGPVWAFTEQTDDMRSQYDAAEQQTHNGRKPGTTRQRRNSNNDRHPQGKFR